MAYTYYIYHIPGEKIGCTTDLAKRMKDQGFTNWEILWQEEGDYEFGWIAGDKEIELQKQYDLPVDTSNYQQSRINRPTWNDDTRKTFTSETARNGGKKGKDKPKSIEHKAKISLASLNRPTRPCEICSNQVKVNVYKQHVNSHKKSL